MDNSKLLNAIALMSKKLDSQGLFKSPKKQLELFENQISGQKLDFKKTEDIQDLFKQIKSLFIQWVSLKIQHLLKK